MALVASVAARRLRIRAAPVARILEQLGLFLPHPETERQRNFARDHREGLLVTDGREGRSIGSGYSVKARVHVGRGEPSHGYRSRAVPYLLIVPHGFHHDFERSSAGQGDLLSDFCPGPVPGALFASSGLPIAASSHSFDFPTIV
jgi:hypothetical protein